MRGQLTKKSFDFNDTHHLHETRGWGEGNTEAKDKKNREDFER